MNPGSLSRPRDGSGGTFGLLITDEEGVWGKIYRYEDFMAETGGSRVAALSGAAGTTDANPAAGAAGTTDANPAAGAGRHNRRESGSGRGRHSRCESGSGRGRHSRCESGSGRGQASLPRIPKKAGGQGWASHLRELLNYSDRF